MGRRTYGGPGSLREENHSLKIQGVDSALENTILFKEWIARREQETNSLPRLKAEKKTGRSNWPMKKKKNKKKTKQNAKNLNTQDIITQREIDKTSEVENEERMVTQEVCE